MTTKPHQITETNSTPAIWAQAKDMTCPTGCIVCGTLLEIDKGIEIVRRRKSQGYVCGQACEAATRR